MRRQATAGGSLFPRIRSYITEVVAELKKVTWPTREEASRLTKMVLIIAGAVGLILGVFDYGFTHLMDWIVSIGG
jgi:preprotein translocase SecE subunit